MTVCRFHSLAATVPLVQPLSLEPTINADAGLIARCNAYREAHYHALYGISQSQDFDFPKTVHRIKNHHHICNQLD